MIVFKREFTIQSTRCTVNEQQINQNIFLIMCLSSTYISITFSKEFANEFPATLGLIQQRKMRDAQRELCEGVMLLIHQSYSNAVLL